MDHSDIVKTINNLIETCKDGEYGFRTSAEHVKGESIRQLFTSRAQDCQQAASQLRTLVTQYGGTAEDSGSAVGAMHRGWVAVKGSLSGYSDRAVLEETERGEDVALAAYRKALETNLPDDVRSVIEQQLQGVKRNHDQIRMLRDQARNLA